MTPSCIIQKRMFCRPQAVRPYRFFRPYFFFTFCRVLQDTCSRGETLLRYASSTRRVARVFFFWIRLAFILVLGDCKPTQSISNPVNAVTAVSTIKKNTECQQGLLLMPDSANICDREVNAHQGRKTYANHCRGDPAWILVL